MTANDLENLRLSKGWTTAQLGEELELPERSLREYLDGSSPIPRHIALAAAALVYGLVPLHDYEHQPTGD